MNENQTAQQASVSGNATHRQLSPLLIISSVMWVICLVAIVGVWYLWSTYKQHVAQLAGKSPSETVNSVDDNDDGRSPKTMNLSFDKNGNATLKEVTQAEKDDPWDPNGIEDFSFTDSRGQTVTKQDLLGKPFVICFVFTYCRGPCPVVSLKMRDVQDQLKDYDFNLVSLTVDPERDTPEVLSKYGEMHHADFDRWRFVTGKQDDIYGLIQRSFKMPVEVASGENRQPGFEIIHSVNIMLVNAEGRVVGKYDARDDGEIGRLRKDLKKIAHRRSSTEEPQTENGQN